MLLLLLCADAQRESNSERLEQLANTIGSQKAFVSEDEWRDMDKKVGPARGGFTHMRRPCDYSSRHVCLAAANGHAASSGF